MRISNLNVTGALSCDNKPVASCNSGDIVIFETKDCYDNRLMADGTVIEPEKAIENPATGPLYVNGAAVGDILKIDVIKIQLPNKGLMRTSTAYGAFRHNITERRIKEFEIIDNKILFNDKLTFPVKPMIGVIGVAPEKESIPTTTPREHGGNMDCKKITEGSVLYLPVFAEGALLSVGDIHALMGDGEVLICGLETSAEVTLKITVIKGAFMPTPCLIHNNRFMTIQSDKTLDDAAILATRTMQEFIMHHSGMDSYETGRLLSLCGDLAICQIVDPLLTVRMEIDTEILNNLEIKLP